MEKEYVVVVHRGVDLEAFDIELSTSTGEGPIPSRSVAIANPRLGSKRMTHWMLTDQEAQDLKNDPRVLSVEIPVDQRDDIQIGLRASQTGEFYRGFNDATDVNWGLRRINEITNVYADSATVSGDYIYALDGSNVDIVIQDSGIQPDHPDFNDYEGNSRVQQIDWYTSSGLSGTQSANHYRDLDGHGTHCAGIAAGLTYGWAKGAKIYSQKLAGLETLQGADGTGIPVADAFDAIRLWHASKTNGRPTVVNMSWGYLGSSTLDPTGGEYRGTPWVYAGDDENQLWDDYGIVSRYGDGARRFPAQVASVDAEIEDMIDAGIHICIAAGNDYHKADISTGSDYDNFATFSGIDRYYHRPGSPYSTRAFNVGNLDSTVFDDNGTFLDRTAGSSKKGPAVNIWAPGTNIMSTSSNEYDTGAYTVYDYPGDSNFKIMSIGGTSMAAPQVAGVLALHLQSQPDLSPAKLLEKITNDSKSVIYETANNDTDYRAFTTSILGSPNRHLFSRYGAQPFSITGSVSIGGLSQGSGGGGSTPTPVTYSLSAPASINEGETLTITLTTTGIDDGISVPYTISGVSTADIGGSSLTGNFSITSNTASVNLNITADVTTEGAETLTLTIDGQSESVNVTINDTSETPSGPIPTYTLSSDVNSVNEGGTVNITLTTTDVDDATDIAYTITGINANDLSSGSLTGNFTIASNTASLAFTLSADQSTEGTETLTLSLDNGQDDIAITINDTSLTPAPDYEIDVTNNGSSSYVLTGTDQNGAVSGNNPSLQFSNGDVVEFTVDAVGHPFWIKTSATTGTGNGASGVTNNGEDSGVVTWVIPADGVYYYQCQIHGAMFGSITVGEGAGEPT